MADEKKKSNIEKTATAALSSSPTKEDAEKVTENEFVAWEIPEHKYHAHFDCFSGVAGDMMLASCLDAAAADSESPNNNDQQENGKQQEEGDDMILLQHVSNCLKLGIPEIANEFEITSNRVWRGGMGSIAGLHLHVESRYGHAPAPVPARTREREEEQHQNMQQSPSSTDDVATAVSNNNGHNHSHTHGHNHFHSHSKNQNETKNRGDLSNDANKEIGDDTKTNLEHSHSHSQGHSHSHNHHHNHSDNIINNDKEAKEEGKQQQKRGGPLRNLPEIVKLLNDASTEYIDPWVKEMAISAFTELAKAEAKTHGSDSIDSVHFHEVGAIDSIVDTVGTCIALHCLGVTSVSCSRLPIGEGTVWTDHGLLPVPAPATLRLLVDMPVCQGPPGVTGELVTPTGVALLKALTIKTNIGSINNSSNSGGGRSIVGRPPNFTIRKIGIGCGSKDFVKHPNILRLLLCDSL